MLQFIYVCEPGRSSVSRGKSQGKGDKKLILSQKENLLFAGMEFHIKAIVLCSGTKRKEDRRGGPAARVWYGGFAPAATKCIGRDRI